MLLCGGFTCGVVLNVSIRTGASLVVGEDGNEVVVATRAEKWAGGFSGVA